MVICGLDMSSKKSGYSVFKNGQLAEYGVWIVPKDITDWRERILWMGEQLNKFITLHSIDKIVIEDVPLILKNPLTLKVLSALQGMVIGIVSSHNIEICFVGVTEWRSKLGLFTGNRADLQREEMKQSSIEYANNTFGLNLKWISKASSKNEDDIADSINVAYSTLIQKQQFGQKRK